MQARLGPASKKAKKKAPVLVSLKVKNALNKHFYTKEAQKMMKDSESKPIMAEKKVSQHTLGLHDTFDLLSELGVW